MGGASAATSFLLLGGDGLREWCDSDRVPGARDVSVVRALGSLDLRRHCHERLLHVGGILCAGLEERNLQLVTKFLATRECQQYRHKTVSKMFPYTTLIEFHIHTTTEPSLLLKYDVMMMSLLTLAVV